MAHDTWRQAAARAIRAVRAAHPQATIAEEGQWTDFTRCLAEYERRAGDPDHALVSVNTRPVIALATPQVGHGAA